MVSLILSGSKRNFYKQVVYPPIQKQVPLLIFQ